MRWVYYACALLATLLACALWLVVFSELRDSPSRSSEVVTTTFTSGVLPVPPRIRPADPVRAVLFEQLQRGQVVCVDGFYAVRAADAVHWVHSGDERISCP